MQALRTVRCIYLFVLVAAAMAQTDVASAITLRIDYGTDATNTFFGTGNPDAKAAMDAAADFYSDILNDNFSAIEMPFDPAEGKPGKFYGELGGEATWYWKRKFRHPETGVTSTALNATFDADEYVIFVGARELGGNIAGLAGPGGWSVPKESSRNGSFTADETRQLNAMDKEFFEAASMRGETSGFANWGGSIAFDINTNWHFNHNTDPMVGETDFYSVALHELGHTLGLGTSDEWKDLVTVDEDEMTTMSAVFNGDRAKAAANNAAGVPLASDNDTGHWRSTLTSPVFDDDDLQTPVMIPGLDENASINRLFVTDLDAAALVDIGWEINLPAAAAAATAASLNVDTSFSGSAGVAALSVSVVPEPAGMLLLVIGAAFALISQSRLNRTL